MISRRDEELAKVTGVRYTVDYGLSTGSAKMDRDVSNDQVEGLTKILKTTNLIPGPRHESLMNPG